MSISHPTLYPVNLVKKKLKTAITLPPLTRLCCERIVKEERFLEKEAFTRLPFYLYPAILKEAIRNEFRKIALVLMPIWPAKVIYMIDVVPGVLNNFAAFVNWQFKSGCLHFPLITIIRLVRLFFYVVKKRLTPHLRVLDLRGMALTDLMVKFLLREIIYVSKNVALLDDYDIYIECRINDLNMVGELTNFLNTCKTKIHLHIIKLDVNSPDENTIWPLLEQIDPTELFGLQISTVHSAVLSKFAALTALDLEIISSGNGTISTFPHLPQLRRLRFTVPWDNYNIDVIPKSILGQLEHLNIEAKCPIPGTEINLRHLIMARPLRLTEVILRGWIVIAPHLHLWKCFLLSIASTLKMLVLRDCFENDDHFGTILDYISRLVNLLFLDLAFNSLSTATILTHIPKLDSLPLIRIIVLPTPPEFLNDDYNNERAAAAQRYIEQWNVKC